MTEGSSLETKVAQLSNQIQDQSRFTRTVTVICTAAILGFLYLVLTQIITTMPDLIVAKNLEHMEQYAAEMHAIHSSHEKASAAAK